MAVNKYLKMAGVKNFRSEDEMTEAQINERNKSNPLGGYGYQTREDYIRQTMMRQQWQAEMDAQAKQQEKVMLMQSPPERAIGHYAGNLLAGGLGRIFGKDQQAPQPEAQNDPEIDRYNQLVQELGSEAAALEILGQETGNGAMITQAQELRKAEQERQLDMEHKQAQIADLKGKKNEVRTFSTMVDGMPAEVEMEIVGKDADGTNIYKEISKGLKGSVSDTNEGWGPTRSQQGSALQDFETAMTSTENYLDTSDRIIELAKNAPAGPGFASTLTSKATNLVQGFEGIRNIISPKLDNKAKAKLAASDPVKQYRHVFEKMEGVAKEDAKLQALLLEQAYMMATANGQRATDQDVENALRTLGSNLNDPEAFLGVIQQSRELTVDRLMNMSKNSGGPDGRTLGDVYGERLGGIKLRRNPEQAAAEDEKAKRERLEYLRNKHKKTQ
jgi:hypothetical protein